MAEEKKNTGKYPKGKHPNSLKNLKIIQPGESLNPTGRPRGSVSFVKLFRKLLEEKKGEDGHIIAEMMVAKMINQALKGDYKQQNLIIEKIDGKIPIRLAGAAGKELFADTQKSIEKIFSNSKAMEIAIKLSNCVSKIENKPEDDSVKNDNDGDTTNE